MATKFSYLTPVALKASSLKVAFLTVAFGIAALSQSHAGTLSDEEFGEKVKQYLLANPHIIIEAMEKLGAEQQADQMAQTLAPIHSDLLATDNDLVIGAKDAPIQVIEFFDYRCVVCRAMVPTLKTFVADNPNIMFVKKHLPILSPASERTTRYVLATNRIYGAKAYNDLHNVLYAQRGPLTLDRFAEDASELGLDHDKIVQGMNAPFITEIIDRHRNIAIDLQIVGTPAFMTASQLKVGTATDAELADLVANQ